MQSHYASLLHMWGNTTAFSQELRAHSECQHLDACWQKLGSWCSSRAEVNPQLTIASVFCRCCKSVTHCCFDEVLIAPCLCSSPACVLQVPKHHNWPALCYKLPPKALWSHAAGWMSCYYLPCCLRCWPPALIQDLTSLLDSPPFLLLRRLLLDRGTVDPC